MAKVKSLYICQNVVMNQRNGLENVQLVIDGTHSDEEVKR